MAHACMAAMLQTSNLDHLVDIRWPFTFDNPAIRE
jgi:hypothetical protein